MGDGPEILHSVALFLQGIFRRGGTLHTDVRSLEFDGLLGLRGIDQGTGNHQGGTHILLGNVLIVIYDTVLKDHLKALEVAAVVELDEAEGLLGPYGTDPAAHGDLYLIKGFGIGKNFRNQCSFHIVLSIRKIIRVRRRDCISHRRTP